MHVSFMTGRYERGLELPGQVVFSWHSQWNGALFDVSWSAGFPRLSLERGGFLYEGLVLAIHTPPLCRTFDFSSLLEIMYFFPPEAELS